MAVIVVIFCDMVCETRAYMHGSETLADARRDAREGMGWSHDEGEDFCPECTAKIRATEGE